MKKVEDKRQRFKNSIEVEQYQKGVSALTCYNTKILSVHSRTWKKKYWAKY